jgi:peptidoglycan/xylan/chitin deacetylase (PgdA/CDA1 family)
VGGVVWWFSRVGIHPVRDAKMQNLLEEQNKQLADAIAPTTTDQFTGEEGVSTTTVSTTSTIVSSTISKLPPIKDMKVGFGILMYHYIDDNPHHSKVADLHVVPETLEAQIKYLLNKGYTFVTYNEALDLYKKDGKVPPKTLVLTFDDGYRSLYTAAFPILKKYHVKASAYIISQDIGHEGNVTWDMLKELSKSGLVEIGDHTVNHKNLKKLSEADQLFQIGQNKTDLEKGLGITVHTMVYPYGEYNTTTEKIVKDLNFKGAAAVYNGVRPNTNNFYNWRRVQIENKDVGDELLKTLYVAFEYNK